MIGWGGIIVTPDNDVISFYRTAGKTGLESKGVALIPGTGTGIFDFPGFSKFPSSPNH
jgi:hypothetical protein